MYYSRDYFDARDKFRALATSHKADLRQLPLPDYPELSTDIAIIGPTRAKKVLIHSSGLHGVEGFSGSAIQCRVLDSLPNLADDTALILVHCLNPYGMNQLRRVNENNVDLNRNFYQNGHRANPAYAKMDDFLNPKSPAKKDFFLMRALGYIARYGYRQLEQAIASGQYEYEKGLFYGGATLQPAAKNYLAFLQSELAGAESIFAIDVHTGLGPSAQSSLAHELKHGNSDTLAQSMGIRLENREAKQASIAYEISGGLNHGFASVFADKACDFLIQEFGSYPALKVLSALRDENRQHHYGNGDLNHPAKQTLLEVFAPKSEAWRAQVLLQGEALLHKALHHMARQN